MLKEGGELRRIARRPPPPRYAKRSVLGTSCSESNTPSASEGWRQRRYHALSAVFSRENRPSHADWTSAHSHEFHLRSAPYPRRRRPTRFDRRAAAPAEARRHSYRFG